MIQKPNSPSSRGDRTGILIASVCFVHCIAGPVLLSFAGFASLIGISEKLEPLFLLGSLAMGVATLIPGYRRHHGRRSCLAMFCTGIVCLLLRHHIPSRLPMESIGAGIGVCFIAGAHILNLKFSRNCSCCEPVSAQDCTGQEALPDNNPVRLSHLPNCENLKAPPADPSS
jgi:MerC mercury resistance protein